MLLPAWVGFAAVGLIIAILIFMHLKKEISSRNVIHLLSVQGVCIGLLIGTMVNHSFNLFDWVR